MPPRPDDYSDIGFVPDAPAADAGSDVGFVPDAPKTAPAAPPPAADGPGVARTLVDQAGQGLLAGFGDEAMGGMQAGLQKVANFVADARKNGELGADTAARLLDKIGIEARYSQDVGDVYRSGRDENRRQFDAEDAAHHKLAIAANVAGGLLGTYLLPGAGAKTLGQAMKTGAAFGALQGLGSSNADLTRGEVGQAALDTGIGGAFGGTAGAVFHGAGVGASKALGALGNRLEAAGISQGRRVLLNGADALSRRKPVSDEAVKEALDSGAIKFLGTTKGAFERLEGLTEEQAIKYNDIIQKLDQMGVDGPAARDIARDLATRGKALLPHTMNDALPAEYLDQAQRVLSKQQEGSSRLGLEQAENLKRSLQDQAKYGKVEETPLNEVRRDIASRMRQANEDAIEQAMQANPGNEALQQVGGDFVPTKQRLGNLIEARNAAERGVAAASKRRAFSLSDNLMMAAGLASGHPGAIAEGAAQAVGNNFLRNRGTSAAAQALYSTGKALKGGTLIQRLVETQPATLGRWAPALMRAFQGGGADELAASHYVLSQTDPDYQAHVQQLAKNDEEQQDNNL